MTSNLTVDNNYNLFARSLNLRDLVVDKITNRTGGSFVGPWSNTTDYNDGDIVIYMGCIYSSITDNNINNTPSQTSSFWAKISLLRNNKLYTVNNENGDDNKAVNDCGAPYPFETIDAAYDQAVLDNPNGNFSILIEFTNLPYQFSRNINVPNITIFSFANNFTEVVLQNTITFESLATQLNFINLSFTYNASSLSPTSAFISENMGVNTATGNFRFINCRFDYRIDNVFSDAHPAMYIYPNTSSTKFIAFNSCFFRGSQFKITLTDRLGNPCLLQTQLTLLNCENRTIVEDLPANDVGTIMGRFNVKVYYQAIDYRVNNTASITFINVENVSNMVSNLNSPARLIFQDVLFINANYTALTSLTKTGTAFYSFTNFEKSPSSTIAQASNSFDLTTGPKYNYVSWNTYNMNDIVFYDGCIYSSLVNGNVNNVPSQTSTFWNKVSLLKNSKTYVVNNQIGNDVKAVSSCAPYPFANIDAAYDQAVLDNPTGNFNIIIERTGLVYTLTRNLTVNNVRFLSIRSNDLGPAWISVPNTVLITGMSIYFNNLQFRSFKTSPDTTPMFIYDSNVVAANIHFNNCSLGYFLDNATNPNIPALIFKPNSSANLYFTECGFNNAHYNITITDELGKPTTGGRLIISYSTSGCVVNELVVNDPGTVIGSFNVSVNNAGVNHQNNIFANAFYSNVGIQGDLNSSLNDPGRISMANVNFFNAALNLYYNFNKTGNAKFNLTDVNKSKSNIIAPSLNQIAYDVTTGPQYDYVAWNTYNINDLVVYNGALYKCLVNDTIGITPDYGSLNWDISNVNLLAQIDTGANLNLLAATDSQLLPLGTILNDSYNMIEINTNLITLKKAGTYKLLLGLTSATTTIGGQDSLFNVYVDKDTVTPAYPGSDSVSEFTRGLVSNTTAYPTTNKITVLAVQTTTPNESFGLYVRNTGAQAFNINLRNLVIERIN